MSFLLHPQLKNDCIALGKINDCTLLLNKNALVLWFILVPHTEQTEIYKMDASRQTQLQQSISQLAKFVENNFKTDKLNIATIGNIVPQLHVHIIGRYKHDFCWPQPVWGQSGFSDYNDATLQSIKQSLLDAQILMNI